MSDAVARVFVDLTRVIGYLDVLAEPPDAGNHRDPAQAANVLTTLQVESLMLVDYVEEQVLAQEGLPDALREALDAVCFAVRHEMRRAFAHAPASDPQGLDTTGILRNCFQQSYLILAKLFNPSIEGSEVFDAMQERREQSLALWEDLVGLLGAVREARAEPSQPAMARLLALIEQFRGGSMRYLMSADRPTFEGFADGLKACRQLGDAEVQLHQFDCYLELLINHVRMRSSLSDLRG
jgi:hypothetical protein